MKNSNDYNNQAATSPAGMVEVFVTRGSKPSSSAGIPNSTAFRQKLFTSPDVAALRDTAFEFFAEARPSFKETERTPFLMGGPG